MKIRFAIYFVLTAALVAGCSSHKEVVKQTEETQPQVEQQKPVVKEPVKVAPFKNTTFKISGSFNSLPFTGTVRHQYDSIIWVSAKELGMEVARAVFTKDSLFVLDKMNKEYYAMNYARARGMFSMPLTFSLVQEMFTDTTAFKAYTTGKFTAEVTKKLVPVDGKLLLPGEITVKLSAKKQQSATVNIKDRKLNTMLEFPFDVPKNYKRRQ